MSFILKAQNKSKVTEQAPPALNLILTDYRYAGISAAGLLIFIAISWVAFDDFGRTLEPGRESTPHIAQNHSKNPETSLSRQKIDEKNVNQQRLTKTQAVTSLNEMVFEPPTLNSLESANSDDLSGVKITSHIYTEDPTKRAIFINDKIYRIGDKYRSAEIRDITPTGFVFRVNQDQNSEDLHINLSDKWALR